MPSDDRQFRGLVTTVDAHDLPKGAATEQHNIQCIHPGKLEVRKGLKPCGFLDTTSTSDTNDILAVGQFSTPMGVYLVHLTAGGKVKRGRRPV